MNKLMMNIVRDLAVYFGILLAFFGVAGIFVGARSVLTVLLISVVGILIAALGAYLRKTADFGEAKRNFPKNCLLSDSFSALTDTGGF